MQWVKLDFSKESSKIYKNNKKLLINNYKKALKKVHKENIFNLKLQQQENINLEIINKEIYTILELVTKKLTHKLVVDIVYLKKIK